MIQISNYGNGTMEQNIKLKAALDLCNQANSSGTFKDKVMTEKFTETTDSNATVYVYTQKDVAIAVSFYTPSWWARLKASVSGIAIVAAESGNGNVTFNSVVFAQNSVAEIAGTLRHESLHSPLAGGYTHDFMPTPQRPLSVCYMCATFIQSIIESRSF